MNQERAWDAGEQDEEKVVGDKMKAIARRNEAAVALEKQLEERLQPFSEGVPFDLAQVTGCMYSAAGNEFIARIIIGKGLVCAKAHLKHGEFIKWVENELWFSIRSAQNYIQLVTRVPKDKLLFFSRMGLKKTYALLEEASEEDLEQLTEGEGMKGLSADRIDLMTASQLRIALKRLKEQKRRKQDQIDEGQEQLAKLQKKLDEKVEVDKNYAMVCRKVFNYQLDVEQCVVPMLEMFSAKDALPQTKRAVWSMFTEISARFAYEADLIGVEAGEAVPDLEIAHSEERFRNNLEDLEDVYAEGGLDIGDGKTEEGKAKPETGDGRTEGENRRPETGDGRTDEEKARAVAKADMGIEDGEFVDMETGEITS